MPTLKVLNVKSVRFTQVVEAAGNPEPYTLWQDPDADATFQEAIREQRVMTIVRDPASAKADAAVVGYLKKSGALHLVFPKTLEKFKDQRIIGLKYDLLIAAKPKGETVKAAKPKTARRAPPLRVKIREPEPDPKPETAPRQKPLPEPAQKFRVRASIIVTVSKEIEIEASDDRTARRDALKLLETEGVDFSTARRQVKITEVSKTKK